jgi:hypothetical protein
VSWLSLPSNRSGTEYPANLRASREFDEICRSFLYHDFNLVNGDHCDQQIASEIIERYHGHIRTVRISVEQSSSAKEVWELLVPHLSERVTSLGIYHQSFLTTVTAELVNFNNAVITALNSGRITSFGIYSASSFSIYLQHRAPETATALLESAIQTEGTIRRCTSLDIVLDSISMANYNALRNQLGNLRSLTIRGALRPELGQVWEIEQQGRWFPSCNLTKLQLIHCQSAYAPHIPHIVQLFPALKTLFIAGCGDTTDVKLTKREQGWSVRKDALWRRRAPLESIRLECMDAWEIAALGAIHTEELIITALDGGTITDAFEDKEIYPHLRLLRTELQYKDLPSIPSEDAGGNDQIPPSRLAPTLPQICGERGIVIRYDVEALMFPR